MEFVRRTILWTVLVIIFLFGLLVVGFLIGVWIFDHLWAQVTVGVLFLGAAFAALTEKSQGHPHSD